MKFFCFSFFVLILFSCSEPKSAPSKVTDFVPKNSEIIIVTSNLDSLKNSINNNHFLDTFTESTSYTHIKEKLEYLSLLNTEENILICLSKNKSKNLQFSIITKNSSGLLNTATLSNYKEETLTYHDKKITKTIFNNTIFYCAIIDNTFFASTSKTLTESALGKKNKDDEFEKIYATIDLEKKASILIKPKNSFIKSCFSNDIIDKNFFGNYIAIDTEINQNSIVLSGITKPKDSTQNLINVFKNTIPQAYTIHNIAPATSDGFMSFTFDNYKKFKSNLNLFNKSNSTSNNNLFSNIIEVGVIYKNNNSVIILNSIDASLTSEALTNEQNIKETYREVDIYSFNQSDLFSKTFYPFIKNNSITNYCILDNYFVFASDAESIQDVIANYQNKTTLSERSYFQEIKSKLTDESSLVFVTNSSNLSSILNKNGLKTTSKDLNNYPLSAIQFIYDTNFAYINGVINKSKAENISNLISEEAHFKLEKDLLNTPQFVTNHTTKEKEIIVQDIDNNLYLISNTGKIIWKKPLDETVLGKVEQIDILKNGKLQLAFATSKHIYIIDREGKDVSPFPKKFNDEITQPLSVFDYDNKKDYRFLITQGKKLSLYNKNAKLVGGFNFKSTNSDIICQPKHIKIGSKDFITFKTTEKIFFLDRTGKARINPKTSSNFSNSNIYLYKDKFVTTTSNGNLLLINTDGKFTSQNFNVSTNQHHLTTTDKTFVLQFENKLYINKNSINLDYGNYSEPEIFLINDKIYVSITDLQSQKIYLFNSQGKLLPNFPVFGNSAIKLDNMDNDNHLEFITKGDSHSIIIYQMN